MHLVSLYLTQRPKSKTHAYANIEPQPDARKRSSMHPACPLSQAQGTSMGKPHESSTRLTSRKVSEGYPDLVWENRPKSECLIMFGCQGVLRALLVGFVHSDSPCMSGVSAMTHYNVFRSHVLDGLADIFRLRLCPVHPHACSPCHLHQFHSDGGY